MTANRLGHRQSYPLPRGDFLHGREGPWPQPAPDHPMAMAAEVLHPAKSDQDDWDHTARWNYLKALITKLPLAFYNWFVHSKLDHIGDAEFSRMLTTSSYSKFMRLRGAAELEASAGFAGFTQRLGPLDPQRQYLVSDLTPIQEVTPYPGVYVAPTLVLFTRDAERSPCQVLAMSIGSRVGDGWKHLVLTPQDGNAWALARYFAIQGAGHMISLTGHPATHFPYDTLNAITQSSVPVRHTLFKLLKPHLRLHLAVDYAVLQGGNSVVSETRGEIYAPFAGPGTEVRKMIPAGYVGYPDPLFPERTGTPGAAHPPWSYARAAREVPSDFGRYLQAYHQTIRAFVRQVVAQILALRDTAQGREEIYYIRRWAGYIAQWLPGFPDAASILGPGEDGQLLPGEDGEHLVMAISTYIWDVAVAHSLEHYSFNWQGPHRTSFRVRVPPPDSVNAPAYSRAQILRGWDIFKSTLAFEMFFKAHNVELLKDVDYAFDSETLRAAQGQFRLELAATERRLIAEGVELSQYARLDELACSIQY